MHVFLLLFICLAFVSCTGVFFLGEQMIDKQRADYEVHLERETGRMLSYFGQCFESNILSCNTIFSSKWYQHYRNVSGVYADEFDGLKRIEISEGLQSMITGMQFVSDILVITPALNSVICRSGWYTIESYQEIYNAVQIDTSLGNTVAPAVSVAGGKLCAFTLNDHSFRRDKSVVCLLLDKEAVSARIHSVRPEGAVYIETALGDQTLSVWGEPVEAKRLMHPASTFSILVGYQPFEQVELPGILALLGVLLFALLLACALVSILATRVINRPVKRMVLEAGGQKHDLANPFRFLQDYLDTLSLRQDQLSAEKESLVRSKNRFLAMMNDEIYYGMLTNPHFNFEDEYVVSVIPELRDERVCLLALLMPKYQYRSSQSPQRPVVDLADLTTHLYSLQIDQEQFVFLWVEPRAVCACEAAMAKKLGHMHLYDTAMTRVCAPKDFHKAYNELKRTLSQQQSARLDLPISVENRIVNMLRANHCEKCCQLLGTLHGNYTPDALMRLFWRVGSELDHSMDSVLERYDEAVEALDEATEWTILEGCVAELCACICAAQRKPASGPSAESICWFVKEHFCDPDLCIAQLAERFSLHRTIVSKLIKTHTGLTFSDWLQSLRVEEAIRLLGETDLSASVIAQKVGYANYVTFKRAFSRQCGCTPREYGKNMEAPQE